jgi:hypothetical protein
VFKSIEVGVDNGAISVTAYSCLPFWKRGGVPDFDVTQRVRVPAGKYQIRYVGPRGAATLLKEVALE